MRKKFLVMGMVVCMLCSNDYSGVAKAATNETTIYDTVVNKIIVGAPTRKAWTFKADKLGTYHIVFTYSRPWENDSTIKTVEYAVTVVNGSSSTGVVSLAEGKETTVSLGQEFTVTLEENSSTGYCWDYIVKDCGITEIESEIQDIIGASTQKIWTFEAKKAGTYRIVFTYSRSWEKDSTDTKTVEYIVKVTNKNGNKSDTVVLTPDRKTIVKKGQNFTITLGENASTGYSWSYKANRKVVKLLNEEFAGVGVVAQPN